MSADTGSRHAANSLAGLGGSLVALATPFAGGEVDLDAVERLCDRQAQSGTSGIVVCGSTGEGASLTDAEHGAVVAAAVRAAGRTPVIASCGGSCTGISVALAETAVRSGAAALMCAPPPYVKLTQDGIAAHVQAIARAAALPIVLYDVPGRASAGIADATIARLFEAGLIVALKDAASDVARPVRLRSLCRPGLMQFSGDDATAGAHRSMGGHGCISVTANLVPALCACLHRAWDVGDLATAARVNDALMPLHDALFAESNPIPLKAALASLRLCGCELRLPLTRAARPTRDRLARVLASLMEAEEAAHGRPRLARVG